MRIAVFENIMTPGGHEVDFDRILVVELQKLGHQVEFYVPEGFQFAMDYHVPVHMLHGAVVSYSGVRGLHRLLRTVQREKRRMGWYRQLYEAAKARRFDALILPTSTYRYLRALSYSRLKESSVSVMFILHGINPHEAPKFLQAVDRLRPYGNIRPTVLTFGQTIFGETRPNIRLIYPPTYIPRDIDWQPGTEAADLSNRALKIGFFGQYRREKKLEDLLEAYLSGHYTRPVQLMVQGSTMHPEDADDFERIIRKYSGREGISFLHKGLIGAEWQQAIADVDALLMPYSAPRYRYHWGGMLFTAIGFQKPIVTSDDMNPEVFEAFDIGKTFPSGDYHALKLAMEDFINHFDEQRVHYWEELSKAADAYSPVRFAKNIAAILE